MKNNKYAISTIPVILVAFLMVLIFGCTSNESKLEKSEIKKIQVANDVNTKIEKPGEYAVEPPPFSDGIYPCTECHKDLVPNPVKRKLVDMHDDISDMFNHDKENRWCTDCHDLKNRDSLKLANGSLLSFKESYKLCGQCHGDKLRDWKVGVHGKRKGYWNGKKEYLLCVNCHNPHSPRFKELTPEPPPVRQEDIK